MSHFLASGGPKAQISDWPTRQAIPFRQCQVVTHAHIFELVSLFCQDWRINIKLSLLVICMLFFLTCHVTHFIYSLNFIEKRQSRLILIILTSSSLMKMNSTALLGRRFLPWPADWNVSVAAINLIIKSRCWEHVGDYWWQVRWCNVAIKNIIVPVGRTCLCQ